MRSKVGRRLEHLASVGITDDYSTADIGRRDAWVCAICRDQQRVVDPAQHDTHPLAAGIDHRVPTDEGGCDSRYNVQIAHRHCLELKRNKAAPTPALARAFLTRTLYGTPVPVEVWMQAHPLPADRQLRRHQRAAMHRLIAVGLLAGRVPD